MDHAAFTVSLNRKPRAPGGKAPSGVLLPAVMLAADLADFDATMPFVDRSESRACFDGL